MLNLDQVRLLENRVEKAVGKIQSLTTENTHLRSQLSSLQSRVNELEGLVRAFKDDQGRIEEGILNALDRLSAFEDSVFHSETAPSVPDVPVDASISQPETDTPSIDSSEISAETTPIEDTQAEPAVAEDSLTASAPESAQLDIDAEWQESEANNDTPHPISPDGQMDIF